MKTSEIQDQEFHDFPILSVSGKKGSWCIETKYGHFAGIPEDWNGTISKGQTARMYGRGLGFTVRGLAIDGEIVYYRSHEEEQARHAAYVEDEKKKRAIGYESKRSDFDSRVSALPGDLRERIEKFRTRGGDNWRYEFEAYELMVCEDAAKIAAAFKTDEEIQSFKGMAWEEQKRAVPGLNDGHSGNSFGAAVYLAQTLKHSGMAQQAHGALATLVGCKEYGCH